MSCPYSAVTLDVDTLLACPSDQRDAWIAAHANQANMELLAALKNLLAGDAAGYNDPNIGQGLSLAMRDVRVLSDVLLGSKDWSPAALRPYGEERCERLRRQRRVAATYAALFSTFTEQGRTRRT